MLKPEERLLQRFAAPALSLFGVIVLGALGYVYLEDMSLLDGLYMAVITVTTVGLQEVQPLDGAGRVYTMILILFGVSAATYFATSVADYLIAGEIKGFLDKRKMHKKIEQLNGHFIVCGFGRMGEQVANEFRREHKAIVVVESREDVFQSAIGAGHIAIHGDAQDDDILKAAGVERAYGLVTVLDEDAANLMVIVSARAFSEKLFIIARTNSPVNEAKMISAGAHRVLFPHGLGGRRMAQMAIRPNVAEFLEFVMHDEELELWLEENTIGIDAPLDGSTVGQSNVRSRTGANIVAVRKRTGKMMAAPTPDTKLEAGDILVVLGTRPQLNLLRELTHC